MACLLGDVLYPFGTTPLALVAGAPPVVLNTGPLTTPPCDCIRVSPGVFVVAQRSHFTSKGLFTTSPWDIPDCRHGSNFTVIGSSFGCGVADGTSKAWVGEETWRQFSDDFEAAVSRLRGISHDKNLLGEPQAGCIDVAEAGSESIVASF